MEIIRNGATLSASAPVVPGETDKIVVCAHCGRDVCEHSTTGALCPWVVDGKRFGWLPTGFKRLVVHLPHAHREPSQSDQVREAMESYLKRCEIILDVDVLSEKRLITQKIPDSSAKVMADGIVKALAALSTREGKL